MFRLFLDFFIIKLGEYSFWFCILVLFVLGEGVGVRLGFFRLVVVISIVFVFRLWDGRGFAEFRSFLFCFGLRGEVVSG